MVANARLDTSPSSDLRPRRRPVVVRRGACVEPRQMPEIAVARDLFWIADRGRPAVFCGKQAPFSSGFIYYVPYVSLHSNEAMIELSFCA